MTHKIWIWALVLFVPYIFLSVHRDAIHKSPTCNTPQAFATTLIRPLKAKGCDNTTTDPLPAALATYYRYTNLASRAIFDNDFSAASVHYDSAFAYKQYPFYEDLKKYILVNYKSGLFEKNEHALFQLLHHKKIDTAQLFLVLPKHVFDDENLKLINKLVKEQKKARSKENTLAKSLKEIYLVDQSVRDYDQFKDKSSEARNAIYSSRDSVDRVNFFRFEKLYAQYGFPDEESVGVLYNDEHQWAYILHVLLLHFQKNKDKEIGQKVFDIIKTALSTGKLHTSICASLLEDNDVRERKATNEFYFLNTTINLVMGEVYRPFVFYTDSLMKEVNNNRISVGLDSFHITQKQVVCQFVGAKNYASMNLIPMAPYPSITELPPGLVKKSCEEANVDYHSYKINTTRIMDKCRCEEKVY